MSDPSPLTDAQINRLTRTVLNHPSTSVRKEALLDIRKFDDPRVTDVLKQVIAGDKDSEVRDLARNLLRKREIDEAVQRGSFDSVSTPWEDTPAAPTEPETQATPDFMRQIDQAYEETSPTPTLGQLMESAGEDDRWNCRFCGTENSGGERCSSCGASREATRRASDTPGAPAAPRKRSPQPSTAVSFGDVFLLQTSHRKFLNGESQKLTSALGTGCMSLFMLPFLAVGLFVIGLAANAWHNYDLLNTTGVETRGTYSGRSYETDDDDGSVTYYADYYFKVDGMTYFGHHSVSHDLYNRVENGAAVDILYAPSDPNISRIAGTNDLGEFGFFVLFATLWNGVTWVIVIVMLNGRRRDGILAREGQLVRGELVNARGSTYKSNYNLNVEYTFDPPDGGPAITRRQSATRNDLRREPLPDRGTPVAVLYRNGKHFKML